MFAAALQETANAGRHADTTMANAEVARLAQESTHSRNQRASQRWLIW